MNCRYCNALLPKKESPGKHTICPCCGADADILNDVDSLRREMKNVEMLLNQNLAEASNTITRTRSAINSNLENIREKLDSLEKQMAPAAPSAEPEAPPEPVSSAPADAKLPPPPLEAALLDAKKNAAGESVTPPLPVSDSNDMAQRPVTPFKPRPGNHPPMPAEADFGFSEAGLGQKWLLIVGVIFVVLGAGYFLKYAFDNNWITPAGRVALAYLLGIVLIGAGEKFRRVTMFEVFGLYLIGGGIATFYLSTYSAFQYYQIISQPLAFAIMVLTTVLACALALLYDTKWLAVLGLIGGFSTPVMVSTGIDNQVGLMSYMLILNLGILALAVFKNWSLLNYLGFLCTWVLFSGWMAQHYLTEKFWTTTFFLNAFFLIYSFLPFAEFVFLSRKKENVEFDLVNFALTIPNTLWAFGFSFHMIDELFPREYVSLVTIAYTVLFAGMAQFIYRKNKTNLQPFIMLLSMALVALVVTVPLLFTNYWVTIFWSAQAMALMWAALRLNNDSLYNGAVFLFCIAYFRFVAEDWPKFWPAYHASYYNLLFERWMTSVLALGCLFQSALMASRQYKEAPSPNFMFGIFTLFLFGVLNFEVETYFREFVPNARSAAISVLWSLFSIGMIIIGFRYRLSLVRKCAIGLFAFTVLKVFFVDMENASTPFRIVSSMVLGILLIGASFLYHRYKDELLGDEARKEYRS